MCGIAGLLNLDGAPASAAVLARMLEAQRHRGPDDRGLRVFSIARGTSVAVPPAAAPPEVAGFEGAIGFNRLSILDLSAKGHQPMGNAEGTVFIVFNGEIYNAFGFTAELEAAGFRFHSRSDTEVILYLYERYGIDGLLQRLNGMFSIAIVDLRKREIHLARDHFGVKPFYWTQAGRTLLFASEAKAFLQHPAFQPALDETCLDEYLAFRYCAGERFLLKGVRQLRAGHCMRITQDGVSIRRYWQIPDGDKPRTTYAHAMRRLEDLIAKSVKAQLLSDVKVGCQLSGGIDSSLVSLNARRHFDADMDTFSVVFSDPRYSEERWIQQAAMALGADGHRFLFTPDHFFQALEPATWHLDQPLNHPNSLGIFHLAERARELVTVLLSGEGADEVFGGYPRHYYASIRPQVLPALGLLRRLPRWGGKFARNFGAGARDPAAAFITSSLFVNPATARALRPDFDFDRAVERRRALFEEGRGSHVDNCLKYDMQTYMVDLLVRQDKMTMAHSVENRVPYLDVQLVNFVRSLPPVFLVGDRLTLPPNVMRNTKKPLKDIARKHFDERFVYRSKSGFGLPLADYYADPRFARLMNERLLPGMRRRGIVDAGLVHDQWRDVASMHNGNAESFWVPVALEIWAQQYLDGGRTAPAQAR